MQQIPLVKRHGFVLNDRPLQNIQAKVGYCADQSVAGEGISRILESRDLIGRENPD